MSRVLSSGAVAVIVVALAGCGGDGGGEALTHDEYQETLTRVSDEVTGSSEEFGSELESVLSGDADAGEAAADAIGKVSDELRNSASELEDVEPPEDAATEHEYLIEGLRAYADDLDELEEPLRSGDLAQIQERLLQFERLDSVVRLRRASDALEEAGYTFETE